MALYVLTYDLRKARDYSKLYEELKRFNAQRVLESTWCFKRVSTSPTGLRDHFKKFVDNDDGLFVIEVSGWATYKADSTPNKLP